MEHFANVSVKIQNLNPEVALHSMLMALKPGPFVDSLYRRPPNDIDDLRARAARYIQMEEHAEFRNKIRAKPGNGSNTSHKEKLKVSNETNLKRSCQEVANTDLISLPPLAHTSANVDKSKHFRYHRNFGQTTKECWTLRDKIEELVQAGHLGQYVQRSQANRGGHTRRGCGRGRGYHSCHDQAIGSKPNTRHADQPEPNLEPNQALLRGVINTIARGFAGGGANNLARKRHLRSVNHVQG
ncbi:uncharacterized protein LOC109806318 [Cajanus cajan]|uniref:uncharacterized protein LOC109806318 n=1 Tax=Cajanus cajan TaxID=3821 RepID=UPI00098D9465|nr:uncharacterized protein LOC109806318 [Cajanus cajan]